MDVKKVFVNTYRYDFHFARICIGSIRYWYPDIPIFLIKDESAGRFDTSFTEKLWNVKVLELPRKIFGWGYGKLETLFLDTKEAFFVIDADAVITGPVFDKVEKLQSDFVVDNEVQPVERFNEIYYNLDRISELDSEFIYPGYSFNTGQWFGTSSVIKREDFSRSLIWSEPPASKYADVVFNNDQAQLNYTVHYMEQQNLISVSKLKLMIWPVNGNADFIDLDKIRSREDVYPYIIHWAGMGWKKIVTLPRRDILAFYQDFYYSRAGKFRSMIHAISLLIWKQERRINYQLGLFRKMFNVK